MKRPQFLRSWWFFGIVIVAAIVAVFSIFSSGGDRRFELDLREFVSEVKSGNISEVELDGRTLVYRLEGEPDTLYETELVRGDSLTEILQNEGVSVEDQPRIVIDGSSGASDLLGLFLSFLPIIVILGIVFFFMRMAMNPQKMRAQMMGLVTNVDPVCKETVNPASAAGSSTFQAVTYHFCSPAHKEQFDADPVRYLLQK